MVHVKYGVHEQFQYSAGLKLRRSIYPVLQTPEYGSESPSKYPIKVTCTYAHIDVILSQEEKGYGSSHLSAPRE